MTPTRRLVGLAAGAAVASLAAALWMNGRSRIESTVSVSPSAAAPPAMLAPPPPPLDPSDSVWTIAMLPSDFQSEAAFNVAAARFERSIREDDEFGDHGARLRFRPLWVADSDVRVERVSAQCYFKRDAALGAQIGRRIEAATELQGMTSIVVLSAVAGVTLGQPEACTAGDLLLAHRSAYDVAPHEFGHLIGGLFDEVGGSIKRTELVKGPNCVTREADRPWNQDDIGAPTRQGCWLDPDLYGPGGNCRMHRASYSDFCAACRRRLEQVFNAPSPAPTPGGEAEHTQFVTQVWRTTPSTPPGEPQPVHGYAQVVARKRYMTPLPPQTARGPVIIGAQIGEGRICLGTTGVEALGKRSHKLTPSQVGPMTTEETPEAPLKLDDPDDSILIVLNCPGVVETAELEKLLAVTVPSNPDVWLKPDLFRANWVNDRTLRFPVRQQLPQ